MFQADGKEPLVSNAAVNRVAQVALRAGRFGAGAVFMVYGDECHEERDVWRWFEGDLLRVADAASKANHLMAAELERARLAPIPPVIVASSPTPEN